MATATSYSTVHSKSYGGLGSQGDLLDSANYGTYDTGIGSLTSHPYQYQTGSQQMSTSNGYQQSSYPMQKSEVYPNDQDGEKETFQSQSQKFNDRSTLVGVDDKKVKNNVKTQQKAPTKNASSEKSSAQQKAKTKGNVPPIGEQSTPSTSDRTMRRNSNPTIDPRMNKSTTMRNNAIKHNEQIREKKRRNGNFPSGRKSKSAESKKKHREKTESYSVPHRNKNRRKSRLTDESESSNDENERRKFERLPPVRPPGFYGPYGYPPFDFGYGRYPQFDPYGRFGLPPARFDRRTRHFYENPEYDSYDATFDFKKVQARSKSKSRSSKKKDGDQTDRQLHTPDETEDERTKSRKFVDEPLVDDPYFGDAHALELWRQNRNDYLKNKFKPTIHDVLYSQQWKKSDSYLENQRRRALRESQGFYFPYKQYTLKDYKDLQKSEANKNPYAPIEDPLTERKHRSRKTTDYGLNQDHDEENHHRPTNKLAPLNLNDGQNFDKSSKRQRALDYAKVQVLRNQPARENRLKTDPTEEYVNSLFPTNDDEQTDRENHFNERQRRNYRRQDDEDENDE